MSLLVHARTSSDPAAVARDFAADTSAWLPAIRFDENHRWYSRVAATTDYEIWLLTWLPGQRTGIHDHGGSAGAFVVAQGTLREDTVDQPWSDGLDGSRVRVSSALFGAGSVRRFDRHHVHEVVNDGVVPAVSVHAYAPSLGSMSRYRLEGDVLRVTASERAGADW